LQSHLRHWIPNKFSLATVDHQTTFRQTINKPSTEIPRNQKKMSELPTNLAGFQIKPDLDNILHAAPVKELIQKVRRTK
jgi:hypothetical protein